MSDSPTDLLPTLRLAALRVKYRHEAEAKLSQQPLLPCPVPGFRTTKIYEANAQAYESGKYRRCLNEGGTSSSKTYSILQILIALARRQKLLISVVAETLPALKRGAIRDFMNLLGETYEDARWNKSYLIYTFNTGSLMEYFSADESAKLRGPRRDILFINEANNISWDSYMELDIRTNFFTFLDWNPVSEFWAHDYGLASKPENYYIHSTYLDALEVLPRQVIENIEAKRNGQDTNWWNIYGLGIPEKIKGLVYPNFEQVAQMPEARQEFYGLDFGYSTDPSVLVRCRLLGDSLYAEELIYQAGMTNDAIAHRMLELGVRPNYAEIFADAAEPKSIEEIHRFGFNIKPAPKGAGSVEYGHQKVLQFRHFWTKNSLSCIKEQRNFRYILDKDKKPTDKTSHEFSHSMDARRYAVVGYMGHPVIGAIMSQTKVSRWRD